jgi:integrase
MATVPRKRKTGIVWYVANKLGKRVIFERVGTDEREADRRDAAMKKEIAAGTYRGKPTGAKTFGAFAETWLATRNTKTAEDDRRRYRLHILRRCKWFTEKKLEDLRVQDVEQLARELAASYVNAKGETRTLAPRSHAGIFKMLSPLFRDARKAELMVRNVMDGLEPGLIDGTSVPRTPYEAHVVVAMTTDERMPAHWRLAFTLLFYTGARIGEVCGLTFADYDTKPVPFGSILINKQYSGERLKTERRGKRKCPRQVPVLPFLRDALRAWWETGFEMVYCRKPTKADYIISRRDGLSKSQSRDSVYEWFQTALARLGFKNQTMHATRNTFISLTRRGGARKDVLKVITHNTTGEVIDVYTKFDWLPLCEAVSYFMAPAAKTDEPEWLRRINAA